MLIQTLLPILLLAFLQQQPAAKKEAPALASAKSGVVQPQAAPKSAVAVSDIEQKASALFSANAKYQEELAKRRQIISVFDVDSPEAALAELQAGNDRFMGGGRVRTLLTSQDPSLRETLSKGQSPFAVVVTCSDSRATDAFLFDQELGRIFSIRPAGNSPDTLGIASIEYGVEHLGSKLVVVLGHTSCGAISAVADAKGEHMHGNFHIFQEVMEGLLQAVPRNSNEAELEYKNRLSQVNAVRQAKVVFDRSPVLRELIEKKKIWLVPALQDLSTGRVTFFDPIVK